jgi:transposase-like protein
MTQDDIIAMAREAGFAVNEKARQHQPHCIFHTQYMVDELLERFAALVTAPLQERIQDLYKQLDEAERGLDSQYKLGMVFEREECAKVVEGLFDDPNDSVLAFIVDAIRARGQA